MNVVHPWFDSHRFFGSLVSTILIFGGCARSTDEQQLRTAILTMQQAIEERHPSDFMDLVADDFTAPENGMDKRHIQDLFRLQVLRNERISVSLATRDIAVDGSRATITQAATLTGSSGGWLPERGSVYMVTSGWRKDDGDWKLIQANWQQSL
ncbi:MAG: nuclear transport factor 2 family protein [Dokdonella sp.]